MNIASAAIRNETHASSLLEIFRLRCEARCLLIHNGLLDFHTAIDELQESAVSQRLVATYGQDRIQEIMSQAFARWQYGNG
jgi:hypothetical protein